MKKLISLLLAAMMLLTFFACAETAGDDLQAQLDAANARIEELEALVNKYEPFYTSQLAAVIGDDVILASDVLDQYEQAAAMYAQYGIDLAAYGMDSSMKMDILSSLVNSAVLMDKASELGLDALTDDEKAVIETTVDSEMDEYINSYIGYFYSDQEVTDEMVQEAKDYWAQNGMDRDELVDSETEQLILTKVTDYVTKDVNISEEEIVEAYNDMVASNTEDYTANPSGFVSDYTSGNTIAWNPEGHRAVKQVLIAFDDDQNDRYSELNSTLSSLKSELEALGSETEAAEETEDAEAPRTAEEIEADIANTEAEIDALYEELMPEVNEVLEAFANGAAIDELIAKYNDDPGMTTEPTATKGYAVAADSVNWDPSFTAAAMSIANIGEMSEPSRGSYGIYIVYYLDDITPGAVDIAVIHDELAESALQEKINTTFNDQVEAWVNDSDITYYYDNIGVAK